MLFRPTEIIIDAYVAELAKQYRTVYGSLDKDLLEIIGYCCRMTLETIATTDAAYHNLDHTIQVTQAGQAILKGKHLAEGQIPPKDWATCVISLLCHDIGYVRGICRHDTRGSYVKNTHNDTIHIPAAQTDAALTPYHIERSQVFVQERLGHLKQIDIMQIIENISTTQFPVPDNKKDIAAGSYPDLVRAADLIGQMADTQYFLKCSALFSEFQETGAAQQLGYTSPEDLRRGYPKFFWTCVQPYISKALEYMAKTQDGRLWINSLYGNIFMEEHIESITPKAVER
jgi:hypothetical protein